MSETLKRATLIVIAGIVFAAVTLFIVLKSGYSKRISEVVLPVPSNLQSVLTEELALGFADQALIQLYHSSGDWTPVVEERAEIRYFTRNGPLRGRIMYTNKDGDCIFIDVEIENGGVHCWRVIPK